MKYLRILVLTILTILAISGCATVKTPFPISGSKSDGTITMGYEVGAFEEPVIDWQLVNQNAAKRCQAWHYKRAEAFGGSKSTCTYYDPQYGCMNRAVTLQYQCI